MNPRPPWRTGPPNVQEWGRSIAGPVDSSLFGAPALYEGPTRDRRGRPIPPPTEEKPGARQAIMDAIAALDQARRELEQALAGSLDDTCNVYVHRAGTQTNYARNNMLRAYACLQAPPEVRRFLNLRNIPTRGIPRADELYAQRRI
jgi:hypothetical protein